MKLSNKFTLTRIIFAPIIFLLYFIPIWTNGAFAQISMCILWPLLLFGEFTDYLDGHYARKKNEVSDFGKHFDPFADVILHMSNFVCLMSSAVSGVHYMPAIIFILLLYREMSITFMRMIAATKGVAIAARKGGKFKTVIYIFSGFFAFFIETLFRFGVSPEAGFISVLLIVSKVMFVICLILSYASFLDYFKHFGKMLKEK